MNKRSMTERGYFAWLNIWQVCFTGTLHGASQPLQIRTQLWALCSFIGQGMDLHGNPHTRVDKDIVFCVNHGPIPATG